MPYSRKITPLIPYSILALTVMLPFIQTGYILTLDMAFTPHLLMPVGVSNGYLLQLSLHLLNFVLASEVIEKLMLFGILVVAGFGMHRLFQQFARDKYNSAGAYFAGVLYAVNPFSYDRFMAGQYNVLLGYAFLPWFGRSLLHFFNAPSWKSSIFLAIWMTTIGVMNIHSLGLLALLLILGIVAMKVPTSKHPPAKQTFVYLAVALALFVVTSSYWLVPAMLGHGRTVTTVEQFGIGDRTAFATVGQGVAGKLWHVAQMQGFWAEARGLYRLPQERLPFWGVVVAVLWIVVAWGIVHAWKVGKRREVVIFGGSALVAMVLAATSLNGWLSDWLPFYAGFREPQKFVGLVVLAMALFAGLGLNALLTRLPKQTDYIKAGSILLLVLITPTMFWGFANQLTPRQYPASWFAANKDLNNDHSDFKVLFLPWHQYMYFNFSGRIIANPAKSFFDKPTVVSNNPEFGGASGTATDYSHKGLDSNILPKAAHAQHLGAQLAPLGIKYVLLSKDNDFASYTYLEKQTDLKLVHDYNGIKLYKNVDFGEKSWPK